MKIIVIGLSHKTAPISIRDEAALNAAQLKHALERVKQSKRIRESYIISTCNRTELYVVVENNQAAEKEPELLFDIMYPEEMRGKFRPHLYIYRDREAIEHLFNVSLGLDSLVFGETEIFGQIKKAYYTALENNNTASVLNRFFNRLLHSTKKIRTALQINKGNISVGYVAAQLAANAVGDIGKCKIMVIGSGKVGKLAANQFMDRGGKNIIVASRTFQNAVTMAKEIKGRAIKFDEINKYVARADIVVTAVESDTAIMHRDMLMRAMNARGDCPLFLIDLGVPRNISEDVANINHVFLYNIDDLQSITKTNLSTRKNKVALAESIINKEIFDLLEWLRIASVIPVIQKLQNLHEKVIVQNKNSNSGESKNIDVIKQQINEDISRIPLFDLKTLLNSRHAKKYAASFKAILEESGFLN